MAPRQTGPSLLIPGWHVFGYLAPVVTGLRLFRALGLACLACVVAALPATAGRLSDQLEYQLVTGVGFIPQSVPLDNSYTSPVPICINVVPSQATPPVVPRIGLITGSSFELSVQSMPATDPGTTYTVHCLIAEEGTFTLPDGRQFQAITTTVSDTLGNNAGGWDDTVNISGSIAAGFTNPVVLGGVISSNDSRATAFHANDCERRQNEPFQAGVADGICVGYHVGEQNGLPIYQPETVGVIIVEEGSGTVNNVAYEAERGPDAIDGVGNNGNSYTVGGDFDVGVSTQAGEDGGQGGWAVLFGNDPLPNNQLRLASDEETVAGDTSRTHTNEIFDYWIFRDDNAPALTLTKTPDPLTFGEAGETIDYDYVVENTGNTVVNALDVTDDLIASVSCPVATLAVGASTTCTASYVITPADVTAGSVTNTATADGAPTGGTLAPATDSATVTIVAGTADLDVVKTIEVFDPTNAGLLAVPGNDVLYTITVTNTGTGPVDDDTLFIVDALPPQVDFFDGDVNGPGSGRVLFANSGTSITFDPIADVGFSTGPARPTDFSECGASPTAVYDPAIRFVCFAPKGELNAAAPDPSFSLTFRVRLN